MSVSELSNQRQMETDHLHHFPFGALDAPLPLTLLLLGACASLCFIMSICEHFHFLWWHRAQTFTPRVFTFWQYLLTLKHASHGCSNNLGRLPLLPLSST